MQVTSPLKASLLGICLAMVFNLVSAAEVNEAPSAEDSAVTLGLYDPEQRELLVPVFINSVNTWLRKYQPKLLSRSATGARMQVDYKSPFEIELSVKDKQYQIAVRPAAKVGNEERTQRVAGKLLAGVQQHMTNELRQGDARSRRH